MKTLLAASFIAFLVGMFFIAMRLVDYQFPVEYTFLVDYASIIAMLGFVGICIGIIFMEGCAK